jgi:succinate dehydrogenase / fumarate reductase, iron-sulfur subunit
MDLVLRIWRQSAPNAPGRFEDHHAKGVSADMSFLEMLDFVNEELQLAGKEPIVFEHDCREGICGCCGGVVNGRPHGPLDRTTLCQLHMRHFHDGDTIVVEPWRSRAFPVVKDLMVDRSAFDKLIQAGGFVAVNTGGAADANAIPISPLHVETAMDAAACIGCGACVASCPNSSAMLFVGAKVSHLALLPQGDIDAVRRVRTMIAKMDELGFGACSNEAECELACPKGISISHIARLNRGFLRSFFSRDED